MKLPAVAEGLQLAQDFSAKYHHRKGDTEKEKQNEVSHIWSMNHLDGCQV
jgi:hypothetical protein